MHKNKNKSLILLTSPQTLLKEVWKLTLRQCRVDDSLSLFVIDELHLFVLYGVAFRPEFQEFIQMLKIICPPDDPSSHVRLLLMTATYTLQLHQMFLRLTGLAIEKEDVVWASPTDMLREQMRLEMSIGTSLFQSKYHAITSYAKSHPKHK